MSTLSPCFRIHGLPLWGLALFVSLALAPCIAAAKEPPFELPPRSELLKIQSAVLDTEHGEVVIELFPDRAPWHVANFKHLADSGFYRGARFHYVNPGYAVQTGVPAQSEAARYRYSLEPEFSEMPHEAGIVGMARHEDLLNPERRSSATQFHILLRENAAMNGNYTIFGKVVEGLEVVERLRKGDRIRDLKVYVRP
jgi:peptidylprolyl isomerase